MRDLIGEMYPGDARTGLTWHTWWATMPPCEVQMATVASISPPVVYSLRDLSDAGYGSVDTLRRAIREGRLEAVRVGGRLKVTPETLDAYLRSSAERYTRDGGAR